MVDKGWETDADETHHHWAGGTDGWTGNVRALHVSPGVFGDDLRTAGHLEYIVEAHVEQTLNHIIHVRDVDELAKERRRRQRDQILGTVQRIQGVADGPLRLIGAETDAFPAVDALDSIDDGVSVPDTDSFGRAAPQAMGAALALFPIQ